MNKKVIRSSVKDSGNNKHETLTRTVMENVEPPKRKEPNTETK